MIKFPIELTYRIGLRLVKYGVKNLTPKVVQDIVDEEIKIYKTYKKQNKLKKSNIGRMRLSASNYFKKLRGKKPIILPEKPQEKNNVKAFLNTLSEYRDFRNGMKKPPNSVNNKVRKYREIKIKN